MAEGTRPKEKLFAILVLELGAFPQGYRAGRWVAGEMSEPIQPSSEEDDEIDPSHLPDLADLV